MSGNNFWINFGRAASVSAICIGMLTACSMTPEVNMAPTLSEQLRPTPDVGTLVVRIVNASGNSVPINFLTISPNNLNESKQVKAVRLEAFSKVVGKSTVFASPVPPGRYSLDSLRAFYSQGDFWYSRWIASNVQFGTFDVQPGKVTDLGTVIYYPKPQGEVYMDTLARAPGSHSQAIVSGYLSYLDYEPAETLSWDEDGMEDDHRARYVSMVQNPVTYNERYKAPDGTVYLIGKLGAILKYTKSGEWTLDAVDTDADLLAIASNSSGDTVLGGEYGKLFLKRKESKEWADISLSPGYAVQAITIHDERFVDVILNSSRKIEVRRADLTARDLDWQTMASYTPEGNWRDSEGKLFVEPRKTQKRTLKRRISGVSIEHAAGQTYVFMALQNGVKSSILDPYINYLFRYDPDRWVVEKVREIEGGVDDIANAGAVTLGIKTGPFTTKKSYYRFDAKADDWKEVADHLDFCPSIKDRSERLCLKDGKTIKRFKTFTFASNPVFSSDMDAIAFIKIDESKNSNNDAIYRLVTTTNGGESWMETQAAPPNKYCLTTIPEIADSLVVACYGVSSDLYQSKDGGLSWEHVRQQENF